MVVPLPLPLPPGTIAEELQSKWHGVVRIPDARSNKLDNTMKQVSQAAARSKLFSNHSVRAIAITLWPNAGIPNLHINARSCHRNEQSLVNHNNRPSATQLTNCSDILPRSMADTVPHYSINIHNQIHRNQIEPRFMGSLFSNCSINTVHVHLRSDSNSSHWSFDLCVNLYNYHLISMLTKDFASAHLS